MPKRNELQLDEHLVGFLPSTNLSLIAPAIRRPHTAIFHDFPTVFVSHFLKVMVQQFPRVLRITVMACVLVSCLVQVG